MGDWRDAAIEGLVAITAIVASGLLTWTSHLDSSVFASVTTLCLGYVFGIARKTNANGNGAK